MRNINLTPGRAINTFNRAIVTPLVGHYSHRALKYQLKINVIGLAVLMKIDSNSILNYTLIVIKIEPGSIYDF